MFVNSDEFVLFFVMTFPFASFSLNIAVISGLSTLLLNIVDVAPMYMISGSGSQTSATFVQDYDPSEAKIAIYSDSLGTAQIKKVWQHNNDNSSTKADNSDIYFKIRWKIC